MNFIKILNYEQLVVTTRFKPNTFKTKSPPVAGTRSHFLAKSPIG